MVLVVVMSVAVAFVKVIQLLIKSVIRLQEAVKRVCSGCSLAGDSRCRSDFKEWDSISVCAWYV